MPRWLSILLQVLGGVVQVGNLVIPMLGTKQKVVVGMGVGSSQVAINTMAHNSNPDGTPAETAWVPSDKLFGSE
jgi:hypothetical protein